MKKLLLSSAALAALTGPVAAGGVERSNQSVAVLFEQGRYLEFGAVAGSPSVSGFGPGIVVTPSPSGDIANSYLNFGAAYKADLNDTWSYAVIYNQPWGADVTYPGSFPTGPYLFTGSNAVLKSHALTGIMQYNMPSNVSLYAGLRAQSLEADLEIPFLGGGAGYTGAAARDYGFGYLAGVAYERPDIALRVSLTYNSEIEHSLDTVETLGAATTSSVTDITTPDSLHLEFQTGVAADTLLFGGVRWVDWSEFEIDPQVYAANVPLGSPPLVFYADDRITYTLGVGRRLNETWSVAASVSYEEHTGSATGNLGPTDGLLSVTLGGSYTKDNMKITGGVSYVDVGDATTYVGAQFQGNSAIGLGLKVGYSF